jgi:hypothetical protein
MIQDRPSWLSRPAVVAVIAFAIGAIVTGVVVAIVLSRGGDNSSNVDANVTPGTGSATPSTGTPGVSGTTTPRPPGTPLNPRKPDDALAAYVQEQMRQTYIGACPQVQAGQTTQSTCSIELYRSAELVTFILGPPFSEGTGEAVLTVGENGVWSVDFVARTGKPPVIGSTAVVFGAGDCLNFHSAPNKTSQPLTCQLDGNKADVIGGPQAADGITWWQLKGLGWASAEFLQAAP